MAFKSCSLLQGVSAGLRNLDLTKKRGIDHEEVRSIFFQPGCCVAGNASPALCSPSYFYVVCQ